jgi:hypothetical protein
LKKWLLSIGVKDYEDTVQNNLGGNSAYCV